MDRESLYRQVVETSSGAAGPIVLHGRPGQGKTTALRNITRLIQEKAQSIQVFFPFDHICYSPQFFDKNSIRICHDSLSANTEGLAERFLEIVYDYEEKELRAFAALEQLNNETGVKIAILIDEFHDLAVFKSFPGYKSVFQNFINRYMEKGRNSFIVTTAFIRRLREEFSQAGMEEFREIEVPPMTETEIAHAICTRGMVEFAEIAREIYIITNGNQGYVKAFIDHALKDGSSVDINTIVSSFKPDAPLELKCRFNYEYLVAKSRGEGIIRHMLAEISSMETPNLTEIAHRMSRSLGVTKDYLKWMLAVGMIDVENKRYSMPDLLLKLWIRLYRSGRRPTNNDVTAAMNEMLNQGYQRLPASNVNYESLMDEYRKKAEDEIRLPGFN